MSRHDRIPSQLRHLAPAITDEETRDRRWWRLQEQHVAEIDCFIEHSCPHIGQLLDAQKSCIHFAAAHGEAFRQEQEPLRPTESLLQRAVSSATQTQSLRREPHAASSVWGKTKTGPAMIPP